MTGEEMRADLERRQQHASMVAALVRDAPDDLARRGLRPPVLGQWVQWRRHMPDTPGVEPHAPKMGRCECSAEGERCLLHADGGDLLCTACRLACAGGAS